LDDALENPGVSPLSVKVDLFVPLSLRKFVPQMVMEDKVVMMRMKRMKRMKKVKK
jgi:hypothetical protein